MTALTDSRQSEIVDSRLLTARAGATKESQRKNRPGGITFLAILLILLGILSLCWSGFAFSFGALTAAFGDRLGALRLGGFGNQAAWQGVVGLVAAIVQIVVGGGLLALKRWAWILAFLAIALNVAQGVLSMIGGGF